MKFSLKGRLANFDLPANKALNPLFESIVNSIHAIDEKYVDSAKEGRISIVVDRYDDQQYVSGEEKTIPPIKGFMIKDNGIGFTDQNYESFLTSDSIYKLKLGGKGVGRFTWLKAFDTIHIESCFGLGIKQLRSFYFDADEGVVGEKISTIDSTTDSYTKITLDGFVEKYRSKCPKKLESIASKIIEHCLSYFVLGTCPQIVIQDSENIINLNSLFKETIDANAKVETFELSCYEFELKHIKIYSSEILPHRIHWCANGQEVVANPIGKIPNLSRRLTDQKGQEFSYSAYIFGPYLDANVNSERTNFHGFGADASTLTSSEISWKNISDKVHKIIKDFLEPYLEPIRQQKMESVRRFIEHEAPEYKRLWIQRQDDINEVVDPENMSEDKIDIELYKLRQRDVIKNKQEARQLITKKVEEITNLDEYMDKVEQVMQAISDDGQADLARYIVQRKVVIELLEKAMHLNDKGEYPYEEVIHNLIMPKGTTSEDRDYEHHNLWLIDEKLAYHYFLGSDIPLNQIEKVAIDSGEKCDLLAFNIPSAFTEGEYPFSSVTIIEFKRAGRTSYSKDDNPIDQILGYVREIRSGAAHDKNGQYLSVRDGTPFYCYLLCDTTEKIREIMELRDFYKTPDGEGYYSYHDKYHAYIEVISYRKLIADAKNRNRVLFEKLKI